MNEETGEYEMRPVADTTQRSIFDADYRDVTEPGPAGIEPDIGPEYIEHPELPGEVVDEHAFLARWKNTRMQMRAYMTILRAITRKIHNLLMKPI